MKKLNLNNTVRQIILASNIVFLILLLDLINGSNIHIIEAAGPVCLAVQVINLCILLVIVAVFWRAEIRNKILKWALILLVPSVLMMGMENTIENYQYKITERNLKKICTALDAYKIDNGSYPIQLQDVKPKYLVKVPKSGFGLFNSKIKYSLEEESKTKLEYRTKFGITCISINCSPGYGFSTWARC